ncbi:MAG: hypothetical protein ACXW3B_11565 [Telluria sp.]
MRILLLILTLVVGLPALASAEGLPKDVEKFVWKREGCDHMRGEIPEPHQKARMRELNREIKKLCKGTDQQLAKFKKKYAANPLVIERLGEFDPQIEAGGNLREPVRQK